MKNVVAVTIPELPCQECGKTVLVVQAWYEIMLGIPAQGPKTCKEHD